MRKKIILALDYATGASLTFAACGLSRDLRTLIMETPPIVWVVIAVIGLIASSVLSVVILQKADTR